MGALLRAVTYGKRFESVGVLLDGRVSNCPEGHAKKQGNCWISLHVDEVGRVHMFQRKREREGRFRGISWPKERNSSTCFGRTETRKSQGITRQKPPLGEAVLDARETVPPGNNGGGGGNRTHVRWTVLARPYERSLRFIFTRRKPAGGPLARLARSCSPLTPTSLGVLGKLARFTPKPTVLARSRGRRRYLSGESQFSIVGF